MFTMKTASAEHLKVCASSKKYSCISDVVSFFAISLQCVNCKGMASCKF